MTVGALILILLAGLLTAGMASNVDQLHRSDAAGNGMAEAFAHFFTIAVWIVLGILLLMCGARDGFSGYSGVAMLLVFLLGVTAQVFILQILTASKVESAAAAFLPKVMLAAPVLVMIRAAWGIFPEVRGAVPELAGGWAPMVLLALISLAPVPFLRSYFDREASDKAAAVASRSENEKQAKAENEQRTQETIAKIAALPVDGDLFSVPTYAGDSEPRDSRSRSCPGAYVYQTAVRRRRTSGAGAGPYFKGDPQSGSRRESSNLQGGEEHPRVEGSHQAVRQRSHPD
jgi:hypothetical protein